MFKKSISFLLILLLMTLSLAGCNNKESKDISTGSEPVSNSTEEEAKKILYDICSYSCNVDGGVTKESVETFLCEVLLHEGNEGIKNIFIKDLDTSISSDISQIINIDNGVEVKSEYVNLLAQEIFDIPIKSDKENYQLFMNDPPMIDLEIDTFEDMGNGVYYATAKSIDEEGNFYSYVNVRYKSNNGNIKILSFSESKLDLSKSEDNIAETATSDSEKNDWTKGYTFRVSKDGNTNKLWLKYNNTGEEILLVKSTQNSDVSKAISTIVNVQKSYDSSKIYFQTEAWATSNAIHVVDLNTLKEKFFSDGSFVKTVGKSPYTNSIIVLKNYIDGDNGRIESYFAIASNGNEICELGDTLEDNLVDQIEMTLDEKNHSDTNYSNKLSGYSNEVYNGYSIDYSSYSTVVIPMYNGINSFNEVIERDPSFKEDNYYALNFAIFGEISNLNITTVNVGGPEEEWNYETDSMANCMFVYLTQLPSDMSYITVNFDVYAGEGMYTNHKFTMDDMRSISEYEPLLFE